MPCPRFIAFALLILTLASPSLAGSIVLQFDESRFTARDVLYIELFSLSGAEIRWADLETITAFRQIKVDPPIGNSLLIETVPPGRYVARGYIDEDANNELTLKSNGRPAEPFGFSVAENRSRPSIRLRHAVFELSEDEEDEGGGEVPFEEPVTTDNTEDTEGNGSSRSNVKSIEVRFLMMGRNSP